MTCCDDLPGRLRRLGALFISISTLSLVAVVGCNGVGGGDLALFVDDGVQGDDGALSAGEGEACETSSDCVGGLRCLQYGVVRTCVEECGGSEACGQGEACLPTLDEQAPGFCDGGVDRRGGVGAPADDDGGPDQPLGDDGLGGDRPTDDGDGDPPASDGCGSAVEARVIGLLNAERAERGLQTLRCDGHVAEVARLHSEDMATRGYFDHTSPEGEGPWDRLDAHGVEGFIVAGENIALGYRTASEVHAGWMGSDGHRANILGDGYTHVGVGMFEVDGTRYWTQVFAGF